MVLPFVRSLDHILLPLMWACTPSTFVACPLRFNHPVEQSKCLQMVRIKRVLTRQTLVSSDKGCRVLAVFVHFLPLRVDDCISGVRFPFFCSALTVSNCWLVGRLLLVTMLPREREREREIYHLFAHMPVLLEFCGFLICLVAFLITSSCTKRPMCNLRS